MTYLTKQHAMAFDPDSFDELPQAFDEIKLPFIYVPHGEPEPTEWIERHPDYIKLAAEFRPRAGGARRTNLSFDTPPSGQHPSAEGPAAESDPGAPWPPTGGAASDVISAATGPSYGRTFNSDAPIAAFLRANHALAMAASGSMSGQANSSNLHADAGNADANYQVIGGGITSRIPGAYQEATADLGIRSDAAPSSRSTTTRAT
jgi:hypothetical protein